MRLGPRTRGPDPLWTLRTMGQLHDGKEFGLMFEGIGNGKHRLYYVAPWHWMEKTRERSLGIAI
jgi:hypothetical protein